MRAPRAILAAIALALAAVSPAAAEILGEYRVTFAGRAQHEVEIVAEIPTEGRDEVRLWMPSWTPGSYKIRDHSRFVVALEARSPGGAPLRVTKEGKDGWTVRTPGLDRFELRYRLLCADLTVRTNHVEERFASLVPAATWILPLEPIFGEVDVRFGLPPGWPHLETALPAHPSGESHRFLADLDTLYDSPLLIGALDRREFEVRGVPHRLVSHGGSGLWDFDRAAEDCRRIAEAHAEFWGGIPYREYRILNLIVEGSGGLEHASSAHLMTSRDAFRDPERYRGWLALVSHELFHAWNGKRFEPAVFVACGRRQEVHTPDLWVVEGLTSYYEELILARAGLLSRKHYLEALSKSIAKVQETPGRELHSLAAASHDAWTHHYQPHAHSKSTTVSYYTKGAVVGFLLDAEIRAASGGARSLDDAMRLAHERFAERGYSSEEFRALCSEIAGRDLSAFFALAIDSTEELDHSPALAWFGLRFAPPKGKKDTAGAEGSAPAPSEGKEEDDAPAPGWIGFSTAVREGRLYVAEVPAGTIASDAGFAVDDELIAVAGVRIFPPGGWEARMKQHRPGERVEVLISRRGELRTIAVTLGEEPKESWELEVIEDATPEQKSRLAAWLGAAGEDLLPAPATAPAGVPEEEGGE